MGLYRDNGKENGNYYLGFIGSTPTGKAACGMPESWQPYTLNMLAALKARVYRTEGLGSSSS